MFPNLVFPLLDGAFKHDVAIILGLALHLHVHLVPLHLSDVNQQMHERHIMCHLSLQVGGQRLLARSVGVDLHVELEVHLGLCLAIALHGLQLQLDLHLLLLLHLLGFDLLRLLLAANSPLPHRHHRHLLQHLAPPLLWLRWLCLPLLGHFLRRGA